MQVEEFCVSTSQVEKLGVRSGFNDVSFVHDVDGVGVYDVGQAVGDEDGGQSALTGAQILEKGVFGAGGPGRRRVRP